ncbi:5,6-dimethylbenzimidazole synthase [Aureimonas sp. ME7]|uniref:5,6-dimethylbenzimidazole synthase n=1 Tax=Aureimonas sp. ME7 TaxID=2744252 RepID=UPI0015F59A42|nr:5,6-dimethylbenzimidazole synthase [Aureimonas sp. ME7]
MDRFPPRFAADLETLLRWRRDVRHFRTDLLPEGLLDRLLDLTMLAPSVGLSQPARFVRVESEACRAAVVANFERSNDEALRRTEPDRQAAYARLKLAGLREAPVHLAVFTEGDPEAGSGLGRRTMPQTLEFSAVLAIHTLWLAARAEGVGLGWVSILDPADVGTTLGVPADWRFVAYLCLGWPADLSETPELEREGWERRRPAVVLRR